MTESEIDRIGGGLRDRTLPKADWTHAAHFAAAMWVLTQPDLDAACDMPGLIRAYNEATGGVNSDTEGYHETITQASLRGARAWLSDHARAGRAGALDALLGGPLGRSDWLFAHWSRARLFSVEARRGWIEPDLSPLPF
jgi:hypothetical protein